MRKQDRDDWGTYDEDMADTLRNLEYEREEVYYDYDHDEEEEEDDGCPLCGRRRCSGWNCL